jgi:hypothetical protein
LLINGNPIIYLPIELKEFLRGKIDTPEKEFESFFDIGLRTNINWSGIDIFWF